MNSYTSCWIFNFRSSRCISSRFYSNILSSYIAITFIIFYFIPSVVSSFSNYFNFSTFFNATYLFRRSRSSSSYLKVVVRSTSCSISSFTSSRSSWCDRTYSNILSSYISITVIVFYFIPTIRSFSYYVDFSTFL